MLIDRRINQVVVNNDLILNTLRNSIEKSAQEASILKGQIEELSAQLREQKISR
jgi:SMC interacting uncharacterized protein involved in chromosome segregation